MSYTVFICDNQTSQWRPVEFYLDDWVEGDEFIWEGGNYSCDCNRHLFYERAIGTPEEQIANDECGSGRYKVLIVSEGQAVYEED